ncbi:MAG TPA: OmpA family protein [Planctomycetota bacterium]|nr:OmpA family protein [Planctomycetota bacterium]
MMKLSNLTQVLWPLCLATLFSACVAQEHYEDVKTSAKHYQKAFIEADKERGELALENARLKEQLRVGGSPVDANSNLAAYDSRISELKAALSELGANPGDVTKFAVDGGNVYRVKDAILFSLGSASISPEGLKALEGVAADIAKTPHGQVSVRGHTDNVPVSRPETKARFPHGNLQLSAERAVEAAVALQSLLGSQGDLVVMGFGDSVPVAANDSESNRQKNRRVEIFVANPTNEQK